MRYEDPRREAAAYILGAVAHLTGHAATHERAGGWDVRAPDLVLPRNVRHAIGALCNALDELLPDGEL